MKKYTSYIVVVCVALCLLNKSTFAEVPEHTVIKPIPKSILEKSSEQKNYTYEFPFYDKSVDVISFEEINGTYRKWSYHIFGKETQKVDGIFSSITGSLRRDGPGEGLADCIKRREVSGPGVLWHLNRILHEIWESSKNQRGVTGTDGSDETDFRTPFQHNKHLFKRPRLNLT